MYASAVSSLPDRKTKLLLSHAVHQVDVAHYVGRRILDADDGRNLRKREYGVVGKIGNGPSRHAGDSAERQVDFFRDFAEVLVQPLLRRLVVVRDDRQAGVGADLLGVTRELDRLRGGIAAGAGDDRDAAGGVRDRGLDQQAVFVDVDRRRFLPVVPTATMPCVPWSM